jgi:DNA replication and repair protein RecF
MLTDLRLQNFRSFIDSSFEFTPGVNIIVGPNAIGKTNLIEAILMLARGSSYRAKDSELVRFDHTWARLDGHSEISGLRTVKLVAQPTSNKTFEIDGKAFKQLSQERILAVVLFEPNHLQLFTGSPERRRDYLDNLLEQTVTGYGKIRRQYNRTLMQRNNLLKQAGNISQNQLFPWDIRLSQLAGQIIRERSKLVETINTELTSLYKNLSQTKTKVTATYDNCWSVEDYESQLIKKLETNLTTDKLRGFTSSGPHREDLLITFDGHPVQTIASRGEIRTAVLVLKIIELHIIQAARDDQAPILLLDDVFSELDGRRRRILTDYLDDYQTFITTTDADIVLQHFAEGCNVISL